MKTPSFGKVGKNRLVLLLGIVALAALLAGCVKVELSHKIARNGNSDVNLTLESDYLAMMGLTPEVLGKQAGFAVDKATVSQENNKLTLVWKGVAPGGLVKLEEADDGAGGSGSEQLVSSGLASAFLNRSFSFPYYYYNLSLDSAGMGPAEGTPSGEAEMSEKILASMAFNYRLETFGKIVETNGFKTGDNKVTFDLKQKKQYYVVFRDFFLSSLFGGYGGTKSCTLDWECAEWSATCTDGKRTRTCARKGTCENYVFSPPVEDSCEAEQPGYDDSSSSSSGGYWETTTTYKSYDEELAEITTKYNSQYLASAKSLSLEKTSGPWKIRLTKMGFFKRLEFGDSGREITDFRVDAEFSNVGSEPESFFWDSGAVVAGGNQYKATYKSELETDDVYQGATVKGYLVFEGVPATLSGPVKIVAGDYYSPDYKRIYVEFDSLSWP